MRRILLISVAALALAAASNMTFAQTGKQGGAGGAAGGAGMNAPAANPTGAAPAGGGSSSTVNPTGDSQSTINETPPPGAHKGAQDTHKGAQDTHKGAQDTTSPRNQKSGQAAPQEKSKTQQSQTEQRGSGGTKQGAAERPMTSKSVSLTTEQKTTIRQKVLTSSAPRVEHVNFDIKVGVVVPRTVRIAPLPTTIVEIEPEWRGYMYFVRGDEIIVVEPGSLRIVAVLEV